MQAVGIEGTSSYGVGIATTVTRAGIRVVEVIHALHESKQWLAVATKGTDPAPIANFKAWAATVHEMTRQKGLASESKRTPWR